MRLHYGQIRPTNFEALMVHYGHEPPWPMDRSPHMSLVEAVDAGGDVMNTPYFEYLVRGHGRSGALEVLARQADFVRMLLHDGAPLEARVEHESVLDGNHRTAVALHTGRTLRIDRATPYQTLTFPDQTTIAGRRIIEDRDIPCDVRGKTVLDLGCAQGIMSVNALFHGAAHVTAVDGDLRSTTWQIRDAWGFTDRMSILCTRIEDLATQDVDVVLAFSIVRHVDPSSFDRLVRGRICVLETHSEGEKPPDTGHRWQLVTKTAYSASESERRRDLYVGVPT